MLRKLVLLLALVILPAIPVHAQVRPSSKIIVTGWDAFKVATVSGDINPDAALYAGYVLGVLHGVYNNTELLNHIPDGISVGEMFQVVGAYIDKHRNDADFEAMHGADVVIKAVLEKWPPPVVAPKGQL